MKTAIGKKSMLLFLMFHDKEVLVQQIIVSWSTFYREEKRSSLSLHWFLCTTENCPTLHSYHAFILVETNQDLTPIRFPAVPRHFKAIIGILLTFVEMHTS